MIVFFLTLVGAALLCVSMKRHWRQILPSVEHSSTTARLLRTVGYALLLVAAVLAANLYGTGIGLTLFFALFTVAHFGIALILPYWRSG